MERAGVGPRVAQRFSSTRSRSSTCRGKLQSHKSTRSYSSTDSFSVFIEQDVSFIPVDTAASTLLEMLGSSEPVLHLVHPYTVPWTVISETASKALNIPIIPYTEWLSRLQDAARKSSDDPDAPKHNPALKLIEFFEKDLPEESPLVIGTDKAVEVSRSLREAKKMDSGEVERWMSYWKKVGLLQ